MSSLAAQPGMPLEQRIQTLPRELADIIFEFAVAIETNKTISIDHRYKPPMQIAVNSKTRRENAPKYYSSSIFFSADACRPSELIYGRRNKATLIFRWLASLQHEHVRAIRNLHLGWSVQDMVSSYDASLPEFMRHGNTRLAMAVMSSMLNEWVEERRADGLPLGKDCVKTLWMKMGRRGQISDPEWLDLNQWFDRRLRRI